MLFQTSCWRSWEVRYVPWSYRCTLPSLPSCPASFHPSPCCGEPYSKVAFICFIFPFFIVLVSVPASRDPCEHRSYPIPRLHPTFHPSVPPFLPPQAPGLEGDGRPELNDDVDRLTRWWLQEEAAPELLPFQTETVQDLHALVEQQQVGRGRESGKEGGKEEREGG